MTVRKRVIAHGRVQGVFFRDSVRREAREAGVDGWVRNLDDGRVEAVLEGPADAVERVAGFCRTGPQRARVDAVDEREEPPEGLTGFEVR
jgi:acylphosphatase